MQLVGSMGEPLKKLAKDVVRAVSLVQTEFSEAAQRCLELRNDKERCKEYFCWRNVLGEYMLRLLEYDVLHLRFVPFENADNNTPGSCKA